MSAKEIVIYSCPLWHPRSEKNSVNFLAFPSSQLSGMSSRDACYTKHVM